MRTEHLQIIKRQKPYAVAKNTETGEYELWLMAGKNKFVDQDDVFPTRTEALDAMPWAVDGYNRFMGR